MCKRRGCFFVCLRKALRVYVLLTAFSPPGVAVAACSLTLVHDELTHCYFCEFSTRFGLSMISGRWLEKLRHQPSTEGASVIFCTLP